jgi:cystathionine beta-lyase
MTGIDFGTIIDRSGTASLKWDLYKDTDILPLWVADMDFQASPQIITALQQRVAHGIFGYTHVPSELTEVVVKRMATSYNWQIDPDWLVWLPGLVCGLNIACRTVGDTDDEVLTTVPIYPPFLSAPGLSGRSLITTGLRDNGTEWIFDFDHLESVISPRTRLLLLCNPHNPTGRVFNRQELTTVAELCLRKNIIICSDEIHCELILDQEKQHLPTATLGPEIAARTITLMAPSKTFNLPGLGCSFAIIPDSALRRRYKMNMTGIVPEINTLGLTAALAAYRDSYEWHQGLLDYLRDNRQLVQEWVNSLPGLTVRHVEATYLAWLDATGIGRDNPHGFFEKAGVGLFDGAAFGAPGFLRLNFGCPRSRLEMALQRMAAALAT